jgi:hypothetical protein
VVASPNTRCATARHVMVDGGAELNKVEKMIQQVRRDVMNMAIEERIKAWASTELGGEEVAAIARTVALGGAEGTLTDTEISAIRRFIPENGTWRPEVSLVERIATIMVLTSVGLEVRMKLTKN